METKRNLKYFTSKGVNIIFVVGLAISALSLILMLQQVTRPFGVVGLLIGVAVAVFGTGAKSGESDIDNQIFSITKEMPEQAMIKYEVYERHFITIIKPVFLRGFDYLSEGVYCKKGPDHKYRTSAYNAAQLYFTRDKIYVYGKHISLVDSAEGASYEFGGSYLYEDIDCAYIEESQFNLEGGKQKVAVFSFGMKLKNGENMFRFSVEYGADVDKARDDINHVIGKMAEKAAERAAEKAAKREALRRGEEIKYE